MEFVFAAILTRFLRAPNTNNSTTNAITEEAIATSEMTTAKMMVEMVIIFSDENFATSQLEMGSANTRPAEIANKTAPNSPFESWSCRWISGILDDQVAVIIPEKKKNAPVVHLILLFTCICQCELNKSRALLIENILSCKSVFLADKPQRKLPFACCFREFFDV